MGKVALVFGPVTVYWYGLFLSLSILVGLLVNWFNVRRQNEKPDAVLDLVFLGVPAAILGARVSYVLFNWGMYRENPWEVCFIWQGGMDMYGALIGFILVFLCYTRHFQLNFRKWADWLTPGYAVGYIVSRLGNFFTQENFGLPTNAPWGIYIDYGYRLEGYKQYDFFHPIFLYQMVAGIVAILLLAVLIYINKRKTILPDGSLFPLLLGLQLAGAMIISLWQYNAGHLQLMQMLSVLGVIAVYSIASRFSTIRNFANNPGGRTECR